MTTAFEQSAAHKEESEKVILALFLYIGIPDSMIDLGCGPGYMCKLAAKLGVDSTGVDIELPSMEYNDNLILLPADAFGPMWNRSIWDLCICTEIAEHIDSSLSDRLVRELNCATGKYLLFSAATPGQGGCGHINEQEHGYWLEKLTNAGFAIDNKGTEFLRNVLSEIAPHAWWYGKNIMLFKRQD